MGSPPRYELWPIETDEDVKGRERSWKQEKVRKDRTWQEKGVDGSEEKEENYAIDRKVAQEIEEESKYSGDSWKEEDENVRPKEKNTKLKKKKKIEKKETKRKREI